MIEKKPVKSDPPIIFLGIMGIMERFTIDFIPLKYNNYSQKIPKKLLLLRVLRSKLFPNYSQNRPIIIPKNFIIPKIIPKNRYEWATIIIPIIPIIPKKKTGVKSLTNFLHLSARRKTAEYINGGLTW